MLNPQQLKARAGKLTASAIGKLANGTPEDIYRLWEELVGLREPEDLSHIWAVRLGECTEALSLAWYERKTGRTLTRRGEVVICPRAEWAACTLDAFDDALVGPVEVKHVGGFEPRERIIARYTPQVHWQMLCTGTDKGALSIIEGARAPLCETIPLNAAYADDLWQRGEAFMKCVNNLTPPVELPPLQSPVAPEAMREVDFSTSNSWCKNAAEWLGNRYAAKQHATAATELKAMIGADVSRAYGHGLQIKRSKVGALTISAFEG